MRAYAVRRVAIAAVLLLGVATLTFGLLRFVPGDPVEVILGAEGMADPAQYDVLRRQLGLDRPLPLQYATWLAGLVTGNLGSSIVTGTPVAPEIAVRTVRTLELALLATLGGLVIGVPLGMLAAVRRGGTTDQLIGVIAMLGLSVPRFVIGTLLVLWVGVGLRLLPTSGFVSLFEDPIGHVRVLILPLASLAPLSAAVLMRTTRSALLDVLGLDHVRTARAKGLSEPRTLWSHALRNALIPVLTTAGLELGALFGGAVIIEAIFNWPGLGSLMIGALDRRDYPVIQGVVLTTAAAFVFLNLLVDLGNAALDPRIARSARR